MTPQEMDIVDQLGKIVEELRELRETLDKAMTQAQGKVKNDMQSTRAFVEHGSKGNASGETPQQARAQMGLRGMAKVLAAKSEDKYKPFWENLAKQDEYTLGSNQLTEERISKAWYRVVTMG